MPQLDFTWWIINFFLIWLSVIVVLAIITTNLPAPEGEQQATQLSIEKGTTEWQWS